MFWLKLLDDETYKQIYNYVKKNFHDTIKESFVMVLNEHHIYNDDNTIFIETCYTCDATLRFQKIRKDDLSLLTRDNCQFDIIRHISEFDRFRVRHNKKSFNYSNYKTT